MSAQGLPAHILPLFAPRPPIQPTSEVHLIRSTPLKGVSSFVTAFEDEQPKSQVKYNTPNDQRLVRMKAKLSKHKESLKSIIKDYQPKENADATGDPFKTLFVARLSYDTSEKKVKKEFDAWGPVRRVKMAYDMKGRPCGYAFVEYESERDLKNAYKQADGKKIDGRRVLVDVERGRTVSGWLPRRLGGGRGPGRVSKADIERQAEEALEAKRLKEEERNKEKKEKKKKDKDRDREKKKKRDRSSEDDRKKKKSKRSRSK